MKHWLWSNGTPVTARDVIFWMNLLSSVTDPSAPTIGSSSAPGPGWGFAVPGGFPENVVSYTQKGSYEVVLRLNDSYNPTWFLYNELSQITPIPQKSWDKLSLRGPVLNADRSAQPRMSIPNTTPARYVPRVPGTANSGALGVAQFLNQQSQDTATYSTNSLWQVVDGAFRMTRYNTDGYVKFVPNRSYSGTPKPKISAFEEMPFTSDSAEFLAVHGGSLTIGYIPPEDVTEKAGLERQDDYRFSPWAVYGIGYVPYNFTNPTAGPIFKQLYFRQAFQSLVNQPQLLTKFDSGFGSATTGPVPNSPKNEYTSQLEEGGGVYPFNPAKAVALLTAHGWKVEPGGVSYCAKSGDGAGECGAGIKLDQRATFTFLYASGNTAGAEGAQALQSTARQKAGIDLTLSSVPFTQVIGTEYDSCTTATPCSNWDLADLFVGWTFGPDYLPTGEELFGTGAASNAGYYSNAKDDSNILSTQTAPNEASELAAMFKYEDYLARQLPVVWMPMLPLQLTMYKRNLKGAIPQGIIDQVFPQFYSFS